MYGGLSYVKDHNELKQTVLVPMGHSGSAETFVMLLLIKAENKMLEYIYGTSDLLLVSVEIEKYCKSVVWNSLLGSSNANLNRYQVLKIEEQMIQRIIWDVKGCIIYK